MSEATYFSLFVVVWLGAVAYLFSVWKLAQSLRLLKSQGRAQEAPDIHFNLPHAIPGFIWLVTGRYAKLGDEAVTRWLTIARILLGLFFPMMLVLFGIAATGTVGRS
jgi:hypothetical protein